MGKEIVNWEERLAQRAAQNVEMEAHVGAGGDSISTRGGRFSWKGADMGTSIVVVVLASAIENAFYGRRFDPEDKQPPMCYAISTEEKGMAPHESLEEVEADTCAVCPRNVYGSADTGRGKACKNKRRLSLIPEDALNDPIDQAERGRLSVPPTSVRYWANYVRSLRETMNRPPESVITEITLVPDPKNQFVMQFKFVESITEPEILQEIFDCQAKDVSDVMAPYPVPSEDNPPPPPPTQRRRR